MNHISKSESNNSWYGCSLLLRSGHPEDPSIDRLWEEQIVLIAASSEDEARIKARQIGQEEAIAFKSISGHLVQWELIAVLRVFQIEASVLVSGTEVFSRFLDTNQASELQRAPVLD